MARRSTKSQPQALRLLMLLGHNLYEMPQRPPLTLLLITAMTLLYLEPGDLGYFVPALNDACVRPVAILQDGQYTRLFWSALMHASELHLLYNMTSLAWKGGQLESALGTKAFAGLILELTAVSQVLLVAVSWAAVQLQFLGPAYYFSHCTVGFSGVLFGMKAVATWLLPQQAGRVAGIAVPSKLVCWAELVLIQLAHPEASFLGHLCGILTGLLHVLVTRPLMIQQTGSARRVKTQHARAWRQGQPRYATASGRAPWEEQGGAASAAGMAAGDEPHGSEGGHADLPRMPPWRMVRKWPLWLLMAGVLAAAAVTNPSRDDLLASMSSRLVGRQGFWTGMAASTAAWLAGTQLRAWNCGIFTLAELKGLWFLGAAGRWVILPLGHLSPILNGAWKLAGQPFKAVMPHIPLGLQGWSVSGAAGALMAMHAATGLGQLLLPSNVVVQHFEASQASVLKRPWTLLTSIFCPTGPIDLLVSLQALSTLGPRAQEAISSSGLLALYCGSGACAAAAACAWQYCCRRPRLKGITGALGSQAALATALFMTRWSSRQPNTALIGSLAAFLVPAGYKVMQQQSRGEAVVRCIVGGLVGAAFVRMPF